MAHPNAVLHSTILLSVGAKLKEHVAGSICRSKKEQRFGEAAFMGPSQLNQEQGLSMIKSRVPGLWDGVTAEGGTAQQCLEWGVQCLVK